jgi:ribonuclease BN (tRNA processing enzyme)
MPEVVFVGTSDAFGAGGRRQTAIAVRGREGALLLDCGPTTCSGLAQLGIARDEIEAIAISHFHGDHFAGIPLLLLAARYEDHRTRPIHIAGPRGVERRVRALAEAMSHPFDAGDWTFPVVFTELEPAMEAPLGPAVVTSFPVHHNPDVHPCGLSVEIDDRRIAFSGDTGWFEELPARVAGADLFICECTYFERDYGYHLNYRELCRRKAQLDVERMVLTHLGTEMAHRRGQLDLETADDGMRLKL